ncbi:cytochrome c biogenesis protein CcsA [Cohnella nanjingensis]|uniref:Cytochrome c biogenesis protein CcsA n=1 Tax=Cohnella nanjingensis TaxID=1387779 RepID=A0A7X0VGF9_9BACL|nr:cytochrome c biogenesis protein CcsA [Cohnella nanjingensis]MBB6672293.1 cytochrome c biogenesis protein CcsA [Cohnella nanjingensis]
MLTNDWLTDAVLYVYALSLLFFVSDAAYGKRNGRRIGTGLLVFVWILQTAFLLDLLLRHFSVPEVTLQEYAFFVSWLLVSFSFVIHWIVRAELLVLLVNAVGFAVLGLNLLQRPGQEIALAPSEVSHRLLVLHISLITVAFALLTVAAVCGGMYLFLHGRLKRKKWGGVMSRMPSLETMDRYAFRSGLVGVPLLLLALSTGTAALLLEGHYAKLLDEKVLLSYAAGALYLTDLLRRWTSNEDAGRAARWNLIGYALLIADFFANSFSSFHRWI